MVYLATKSGNRLEAIESVEIAARHGIKTQYKLRKMKSLTAVCDNVICEKFLLLTGCEGRFSRRWRPVRSMVEWFLT